MIKITISRIKIKKRSSQYQNNKFHKDFYLFLYKVLLITWRKRGWERVGKDLQSQYFGLWNSFKIFHKTASCSNQNATNNLFIFPYTLLYVHKSINKMIKGPMPNLPAQVIRLSWSGPFQFPKQWIFFF